MSMKVFLPPLLWPNILQHSGAVTELGNTKPRYKFWFQAISIHWVKGMNPTKYCESHLLATCISGEAKALCPNTSWLVDILGHTEV